MAEFGGGSGSSVVSDVNNISHQQNPNESKDVSVVSVKVSTKALKNLHILGTVFACVSAGLLSVDLAAVVVVVLTAYVFSVLSMAVAMNVLIVLGILGVVFLAGVISGAIFSGVLKGKMIKAPLKPEVFDEYEEENPVKKVDFSIAMTFLECKNRQIKRNQLFEYLYYSHTGEFDDKAPAEKLPDNNDHAMLYTKMIEDLEAHCQKDGAQNVLSAFFSEIKEFWNEKSKCIFGDKGVFEWDGNNESLNKTKFPNKSPQEIKYKMYFNEIRHSLMQFIDKDIFENIIKKIKVKEIECYALMELGNFKFEEMLSFISKDEIGNFSNELKNKVKDVGTWKDFQKEIGKIKTKYPSAFSKVKKSKLKKLEKNFKKLKAISKKI
jgi:hypothetical protein